MGAQKTVNRVYDSSVFSDEYHLSFVRSIDKINRHFFKAHEQSSKSLFLAKQAVKSGCAEIKNLQNIIANFETVQKKRSKDIFRAMAEKCSGTERDIITAKVIPAIKSNDSSTKKLGEAVISALEQVSSKLYFLNNTQYTEQDFFYNLNQILLGYESIFKNFSYIKSQPTSDIASTVLQKTENTLNANKIASSVKSTFLKTVTSPEQKIQTILKDEQQIKNNIKNKKPLLPKATAIVSLVVKIIHWMPFRNTICAWILREDNTFLKRFITYFFGKNKYQEIKQHVGLLIPKSIQKAAHVGTIGNIIHDFLQTPAGKTCIDIINAQAYFEYLNALEQYAFIQLLKSLQQTHNASMKALQCMPNNFVLDYESEKKIPAIEVQQPIEKPQSTAIQLYKAADQAMSTVVDYGFSLFDYVKSNDTQTIMDDTKKALLEYSGLFAQSFLPNYRLPQKPAASIAQQNPIAAPQIPAKPKTIRFINFLQKHYDLSKINNPEYLLDEDFHKAEDRFYRVEKKFTDMLAMNEKGTTQLNEIYQKQRVLSPDLPQNWHDLPSKIDQLHQTFNRLKEEQKDLWFFQILSDVAYQSEKRKTWRSLQQHITAHNKIKIDLYSTQNSSVVRNTFLETFPLSHQDNIDLFTMAKNDQKFAKLAYTFNPLEYAELHKTLQLN